MVQKQQRITFITENNLVKEKCLWTFEVIIHDIECALWELR